MICLRKVSHRKKKNGERCTLQDSKKVKTTLKSILSLIFYTLKYTVKFHLTVLQSSNEKTAPNNRQQEDTYSFRKRVSARKYLRIAFYLKIELLVGFLLLYIQTSVRRCWVFLGTWSRMGLITTNTDNFSILLKATLSWLQCLCPGLFTCYNLFPCYNNYYNYYFSLKKLHIYLSSLRIKKEV